MVAAAHFFFSVAAAAVLLSFFSWSASVASLPIRLKKEAADSSTDDQEDLCVHKWYTQPVDHFNYGEDGYVEFQHKYAMVDKYWGGPSSPIFAYLEGEDAMSPDVCSQTSLVDAYASRFRPLFIFIEHRYYGDSVPFGSRDAAFKNTSTLGFFGAAQAVQDAAELILSLRQNLSAHYSPVIVAGGSYAGMMAAWMRLKYPHVVLGALASSAPILYFDHIIPQDAFYAVVSKDFKDVSQNCHDVIKKSWSEMDRLSLEKNGLLLLSQAFNTCRELKSVEELKSRLADFYVVAAQYDLYPIPDICKSVDQAWKQSNNTLKCLRAALDAIFGTDCFSLDYSIYSHETEEGWDWQTCSEMVMPLGSSNETMFYPNPFILANFSDSCMRKYGVRPKADWIISYFGGQDIKLVLKRFGSNIIFSNGLIDPYSSGGVLEDLSDTLVALKAQQGSHCFDLYPASGNDPEWLVKIKAEEVKIVAAWLEDYYKDLGGLILKKV